MLWGIGALRGVPVDGGGEALGMAVAAGEGFPPIKICLGCRYAKGPPPNAESLCSLKFLWVLLAMEKDQSGQSDRNAFVGVLSIHCGLQVEVQGKTNITLCKNFP